jgi:hypothetical protein
VKVPKTLTPARLKRGILTEAEIDLLAKEAARHFRSMGPPWAKLIKSRSKSLRDHFRYSSVAQRCRDARSARGLSFKETAAALRLPQYRVKAIEAGLFQEFRLAHLQQYVDLLRLLRLVPALVQSESGARRQPLGGAMKAERPGRSLTV